MRHVPRNLATLALLLPVLGGCLSSGASLSSASVPPIPARAAALKGSLGQAASLKLSAAAEQRALGAEYQALQFGAVGQPVAWEADGFRGEIIPTQLYRVGSQDCRGFTHVISRGTSSIRQVGSACRSDDDLWTPVA